MFPRQKDMEIPLLRVLASLGGQARPQEVYPAITKVFPELTEADLSEPLSSGGNKWTNRIQWIRQKLIAKGEVEKAGYGVWAITEKGTARLELEKSSEPRRSTRSKRRKEKHRNVISAADEVGDLESISEEYSNNFKQKVLSKLQDLSPVQFEQFSAVLLKAYGFQKIAVTGKSGDGGIDGHGQLRVGLAVVKAAFQCKRWQNSISAKEVQAFRGAIQGQFEQGYFFTTSTFTKPAQQESIKMGAAPIILFEGEQIVEIMIEKGVGIKRRPVEIYEDQLEQLFET
jgi:restriction system protein